MSIESLNAFSMDFFSLKGKTAIVTGGNSGLGQAFAMALAKAGANVFIPSFVKDNGETKEMIEKQGVEVDFMQVDITAEGAPQKIIAACCERFGTVDILVNNAGICKLNKVLDFGRADWDPMIDVNQPARGQPQTVATGIETAAGQRRHDSGEIGTSDPQKRGHTRRYSPCRRDAGNRHQRNYAAF